MTPSQMSTTELVAAVKTRRVEGTFFRHAAPGRDAFAGGFGGRWGAQFPVIYLGRPTDNVVVEAHRHLVEDAGVPVARIKPRVLYTVPVVIDDVLDLTDVSSLASVGLTQADLQSDVGNYSACQNVGSAAHQLRVHGILAPSASGLGETLALFRERLSVGEIPVPTREEIWSVLPRDPRSLRLVAREEETGS